MKKDDPALLFLKNTLSEKILALSNDPGECGRYITEQIRELIGVKLVALYEAPASQGGKFKRISVSPKRYKSVEGEEMEILCRLSEKSPSLLFLDPQNETGSGERALKRLGLGDSLIIPLLSGKEHVGALLLLGLFSKDGILSIIETLKSTSSILGLIFKNSLLFRNLDNLVEKKTTNLRYLNKEMERLKSYLSNVVNSMPSAVIGIDRSGEINQWNATAEVVKGIKSEQTIGKKLDEICPYLEHEMSPILENIQKGEIYRINKVLGDYSGKKSYEEIICYPLKNEEGAVILINDISERVHLEEIMIQGEKMLSVGGLAAGMAHEINNPLAGLMQSGSVLSRRLTDSSLIETNLKAAETAGVTLEGVNKYMKLRGVPRLLEAIDLSGKRIASIVDKILSFAKTSSGHSSCSSVELLIEQAIELAASDYNLKNYCTFAEINIEKEFEETPPIVCDRSKLQQVFLNLLINSGYALKDQINKSIYIKTRHLKSENEILIEIGDNGPGIDGEMKKRIFEPFFTTKGVGEGTGLGLSVSYFIITENHNGTMFVSSTPGKGVLFTIRLPLSIELQ